MYGIYFSDFPGFPELVGTLSYAYMNSYLDGLDAYIFERAFN